MPASKSKSKSKTKAKSKSQAKLKSTSGSGNAGSGETGSIELIARGLILAGDFVLLCRHVRHGYHYLPGGHVEFGEAAAEALERELVEECGLRVRAGDLVLVTEERFDDGKVDRHEVNLVFHVEHRFMRARGVGVGRSGGRSPRAGSPAPVVSLEPKIAFDWVDLRRIATLDLRPETIKRWVAGVASVDSGKPIPLTWIAGQ